MVSRPEEGMMSDRGWRWTPRTWLGFGLGILVGALIVAGMLGVVYAQTDGVIKGCVHQGNNSVRILGPGDSCNPQNETPISWNIVGPTGPQGPTGSTGPMGSTGATGAAGPSGAAGPTGAQGPAGPTGAAGAQGPAGPAGASGAPGAQGPAGATGAQGPSGPSLASRITTIENGCPGTASCEADCGMGFVATGGGGTSSVLGQPASTESGPVSSPGTGFFANTGDQPVGWRVNSNDGGTPGSVMVWVVCVPSS
jgi:hypothetical protein